MTIKRNSARCDSCGEELESKYRHDFVVHYCKVDPTPGQEWQGDKLVPTGKTTWKFAVDGGKDYIRRCGSGFTETSTFSD